MVSKTFLFMKFLKKTTLLLFKLKWVNIKKNTTKTIMVWGYGKKREDTFYVFSHLKSMKGFVVGTTAQLAELGKEGFSSSSDRR